MEGGKKVRKKETNYEKAIDEAFKEISQNIKEIERGIQRRKELVYLEKRRSSGPVRWHGQRGRDFERKRTVSGNSNELDEREVKRREELAEYLCRRRGSAPATVASTT